VKQGHPYRAVCEGYMSPCDATPYSGLLRDTCVLLDARGHIHVGQGVPLLV